MKKLGTFTKFDKELNVFFDDKKGCCFLVTEEGKRIEVGALKHADEKYTFTVKDPSQNAILNQETSFRLHLLTDLAKEAYKLQYTFFEQKSGYGHAGGAR